MGFSSFLGSLLVGFFRVLAWPSFSLLCPLYASIRVVEGDEESHYQQCLNYWVLFSITTMVEYTFSKLLVWLPFWPSIKGMASLLLLIHSFAGASHVYKCFIQPYVLLNSRASDVALQEVRCDKSNEQNEYFYATKPPTKSNQDEEIEKQVIYQGVAESNVDHVTSTSSPKTAQNEWTCVLCLVSTRSETSLNQHFSGKRHKDMEAEVRRSLMMANFVANISKGMADTVLLESLHKLRSVKLSGFLSPLKSISWCTWKKPKLGWTKLNTDGSVSGLGGLLRDSEGKPICAFVSKVPLDDSFLVELLAIWRGLVLALGLGIKVIWIESDSMAAVKTINKKQSFGPKASSCLLLIWELLGKFEEYYVCHSWRETNRAADYLSKMDHLLGSDVVLLPADFPNALEKIIKEDAEGKRYRRV